MAEKWHSDGLLPFLFFSKSYCLVLFFLCLVCTFLFNSNIEDTIEPLGLFFLWPLTWLGPEYDDDLNDEISVQQILRDMLDKEVVEKDILNDLGFEGNKQRKDPRPKMELRHKQVLWHSMKINFQ